MSINQTIVSIVILVVTGLSACTSTSGDQQNSTESGGQIQAVSDSKPMPAFAMLDVNGNTVNLSSFKGKKVFVNLWASWCPPCRAEMPSIEALAGKLSNANTEFVLLSLDEKFELAKNYVSKASLTVPVYYPAEKLPALFVTEGIPATFIFDENGNLIKQNNGADNYNTDYYVNLLTKN